MIASLKVDPQWEPSRGSLLVPMKLCKVLFFIVMERCVNVVFVLGSELLIGVSKSSCFNCQTKTTTT